jgi:branched-chain amino acid transport system ATP-binding protein
MTDALLSTRALSVRYGATVALQGADLRVSRAGISALLGANGAGKSSALKAIAGLVPASGMVEFDSQDISRWDNRRRYRAGIVYVPEGREIVSDLTVDENLLLGSYFCGGRERSQRRDMVLAFFPEIAGRLRSPAGLMSGGEQQMLAIGRALMSGPRLLLLDEPSLGLAPQLVVRVFERLAAIQREQALSALLVEQSFPMAARLADHAWFMRHGEVTGEFTGDEMRSGGARERATQAYLGAQAEPALSP